MPSVLSLLDLLPNGGGDGKAFECLTLDSMRKFNEETPDVEGVKYYSWGAVYDPGLIDTWKYVFFFLYLATDHSLGRVDGRTPSSWRRKARMTGWSLLNLQNGFVHLIYLYKLSFISRNRAPTLAHSQT